MSAMSYRFLGRDVRFGLALRRADFFAAILDSPSPRHQGSAALSAMSA